MVMENSKIEKDRFNLSDSHFIKTKNNPQDSPFIKDKSNSQDSPFKKNIIQPDSPFSNGTQSNSPFLNETQNNSPFSNGTQNNSPFSKGVRGIKGDIENKNHKGYYIPYNRNLKTLSRKLRKESTLAEILLWNELKGKKLGYTFNRQKPLLNYIVDFYCKPLYLIIEIDGYCHDTEEAYDEDMKRQKKLEDFGLVFLRFDDREVKKDMPNVLRVIKAKIKELEEIPPAPFKKGE